MRAATTSPLILATNSEPRDDPAFATTTATRLNMMIEAQGVQALKAIGDEDERLVRRLTVTRYSGFTTLLRGAAEAGVVVVIHGVVTSKGPERIEVLADLRQGVSLVPMTGKDALLMKRYGLDGDWKDRLRAALWQGVEIVIRTDLPFIE